MEDCTVNIMLNATADLNRGETEDLYIPVRMSEYRRLIESYYEMKAKLDAAEERAIDRGSEAYRRGERVKQLEAENAALRQKLVGVKEAAE